MTDFMHRLASRALGDGPALSPRLPSWFEPVAGTAAVPAIDLGDAEMPHAPRQATTPPEPPATTHAVPRATAEATPSMPARHAPASNAKPPSVSAAPRGVAHGERGPVAIEVREARPPAKAEPSSTLKIMRAPSADTVHPAPAAMPGRVDAPKAEAPVRQLPSNGVLLPPTAPVFPPARHDVAAREPHPEARMRGGDPSMARRAAPPAEPVVHVSIGRIEVRAAPSPAPAPARRREERAIGGLDDYLRQRQGKAAP